MMYETTIDGLDQQKTIHTRWSTTQLLMVERDEKSAPDDILNKR